MKALRAALVVVILVIAATALLTASVRGGEASIRRVIAEFQTLITGCLAIVAAYMTVAQMRKSDRRSDERHEELIRLQLRSDGLTLDRAFFSVVPALEQLKSELDTAEPFLLRGDDFLYEDVEAYRGTSHAVSTLADRAAASFAGDVWKRAENLFDGAFGVQVSYTLRDIYRLRSIASLAATITSPDPSREFHLIRDEERFRRQQAEWTQAIRSLPSEFKNCSDSLSEMISMIATMSKSYKLRW